uniref:Uncharacterized protein n=1 Tax=Nelumbo nucifera TaxID=4432 RepID=A0A822ZEK8_NELNU|nr:TPA_asm: hypothetical protein HUJ06_001557 [Nelumbo nucifera]
MLYLDNQGRMCGDDLIVSYEVYNLFGYNIQLNTSFLTFSKKN